VKAAAAAEFAVFGEGLLQQKQEVASFSMLYSNQGKLLCQELMRLVMGDYRLLGIDTTQYQAQTGSNRYCTVSKMCRLLSKLDIYYNPVVVSSFSLLFLIKFTYFLYFAAFINLN
jgi:hypothetical protein